MNREWMDQALCAQTDPDLFFPDGVGGVPATAKKICAKCPVQTACAAYAAHLEGGLAHRYRHGTWGGAAPRARANRANGHRRQQDEAARRAKIIQLAEDSYPANEIAALVGRNERTVYRILREHRDGQETAA